MKEKPILFNSEMVRAILDGRKTQTRRVIKFPKHTYTPDSSWVASLNPDGRGDWIAWGPRPVTDDFSINAYLDGGGFPCPYGKPGDMLWVRETWLQLDRSGWCDPAKPKDWYDPAYRRVNAIAYRANADTEAEEIRKEYGYKWRPSIFMPRWASRLTLKVTTVKAERVQDISDGDLLEEGMTAYSPSDCPHPETLTRDDFRQLWDSINAKRGYSWDTNPWVWVVEFEAVQNAALRS